MHSCVEKITLRLISWRIGSCVITAFAWTQYLMKIHFLVELVIHGSPSKLNNKNMGHHAFYQINLERGQTFFGFQKLR